MLLFEDTRFGYEAALQNGRQALHIIVEKVNEFSSLSVNDSRVELWKLCQNDYLHEIMLVDLSLKLQS